MEWETIDAASAKLNEKIRRASALFVTTYAEQELNFARKHPEAVSQEYFLKTLVPLLHEINNVDWNIVEEEIKKVLQQFFAITDFTQFVEATDTNIFVEARDPKTGYLLGAIQFLASPKFEPHHIRACYFGTARHAQEQGVDLLLMSSIFMIVPDTTRIFLHTRVTNEKMLNVYSIWGFRQFPGTLTNWPDLEYTTEKSNILQNTAYTLVR